MVAGEPPSVRWRALLGAALITTAGCGVLFAYRAAENPPEDRYLVVTAPVAQGQRISSAMLGTVAADLPGSVDALRERQADLAVGRIAARALEPETFLASGDLVDEHRFTQDGETEVSVTLDPQRTPLHELQIGDVVSVLSTGESGTRALTESARVTGLADRDTGSGIGVESGLRITFGVADLDEAAAIIDAAVGEELTVAVSSPGPSGDAPPGAQEVERP